MMNLDDTIVALSSAAPRPQTAAVSIVRLSGAGTFGLLGKLFPGCLAGGRRRLGRGTLEVKGLSLPVVVYSFIAPHSYTGQDMAELHIPAAGCVIQAVLEILLSGARQAQPGEFTWRAYLNGRMDLTQAESVAQIVSGASAAQVAAAEKLLAGNLSEAIAEIRREILDVLSRIEAGLDFADEEITLIAPEQAADALLAITARLTNLLDTAIRYERMIDLPCAGIAGAVNAGKSTLVNALLGRGRSMVSGRRATTRDVLAEILSLEGLDCVLFDCAGLAEGPCPEDPLDELAQQAARSALAGADAVLFCVDLSKDNLSEDQAIYSLLAHQRPLAVAAQCDRVETAAEAGRLRRLRQAFGCEFLPVSAHTGRGLTSLKTALRDTLAGSEPNTEGADQRIAINRRHRQILTDAAAELAEAEAEIRQRNEEIAAMMLRAAWTRLGGIEREDVAETVLDQIFSRFCVGK